MSANDGRPRTLMARALAGLVALFAITAASFFGAAGTLRDQRAWLFLTLFFGLASVITIWLWRRDPALLERRLKAGPGSEPDPAQNVAQALASLAFLGCVVMPGLDRRFGWSSVPPALSALGDALTAAGFLIVFLTFRANTFAAGTIELAEFRQVIQSGPYAVVRQPLYAGALVLIFGIPLALGSWWGLLPAATLVPVLAWRLTREEAFLTTHLPGYAAYRSRVRARLLPGLW